LRHRSMISNILSTLVKQNRKRNCDFERRSSGKLQTQNLILLSEAGSLLGRGAEAIK
jgi:hypothetical protein